MFLGKGVDFLKVIKEKLIEMTLNTIEWSTRIRIRPQRIEIKVFVYIINIVGVVVQ